MSGLPKKVTEKKIIKELKDVLDIINILPKKNRDKDKDYLASIIDEDRDVPLGASESGVPRPFSHGVWFRGEQNIAIPTIPTAYRLGPESKRIDVFDEKNAFLDLKLRMTRLDTKRYNSFELHCMMRHHGLPSRLLDWSENPLTALYFAVSKPNGDIPDNTNGVLTCLNAYRLNEASCITKNTKPGMFYPDSANVLMRSLMAEHTKLIDVLDRMTRVLESNETDYNKRVIDLAEDLKYVVQFLGESDGISKEEVISNGLSPAEIKRAGIGIEERIVKILERTRYPAAVVPKRTNLRMAAQLSNFTIHGGKQFGKNHEVELYNCGQKPSHEYLSVEKSSMLTKETKVFSPVSLDELNVNVKSGANEEYKKNKPFLLHFEIDKDCKDIIRDELDRLSINNASLFPEFDSQASFVKTRWTKHEED